VGLPNNEGLTQEAKGGEGRERVDEWLSEQPDSAWKEVTTREGTRGAIRYEVLHARVWVYAGSKEPPRQWHLLVRREIDTPRKVKYTLSNAPADMPLDRLAYIQGQRYWVERALQDAKRHSGLGDYQVRGWLGWNHHMAGKSSYDSYSKVSREEHVQPRLTARVPLESDKVELAAHLTPTTLSPESRSI
jgi:hypothetical protein